MDRPLPNILKDIHATKVREVETLLKKGAYGALMDDETAGDKFCEEDIEVKESLA